MSSGYIISNVRVTNPQQYEEYKKLSSAAMLAHGAQVCVRGGVSEVLEGDWQPDRIVVLKFPSVEKAKAFYDDVKGRMAKFGRAPAHLKIMAGFNPVIGNTELEAEEKHQFLQSRIHPEVGLELLSAAVGGFDLSGYPLDGPLPDIPGSKGSQGHFKQVMDMARVEGLTIRQIYMRYAGARGNRTVKGTPRTIADEMESWFLGGAIDGFLIQPPYLPGGLDAVHPAGQPDIHQDQVDVEIDGLFDRTLAIRHEAAHFEILLARQRLQVPGHQQFVFHDHDPQRSHPFTSPPAPPSFTQISSRSRSSERVRRVLAEAIDCSRADIATRVRPGVVSEPRSGASGVGGFCITARCEIRRTTVVGRRLERFG